MIEGRNIVCVASNWFYDPTSKHHVMRVLAERNHVLWVNFHGSRRPGATWADAGRAAERLKQFIQGPRRIHENLTVLTPIVLPLPGSSSAAAINRRLLVRQIRHALGRLPSRPVQLWSFAPDVDCLCGRFGEERALYYCVDEFSEFSGYDRSAILAAEARLAAKSDLVVTTSRVLFDAKQALQPRTILVTHGVDVAHFASAANPMLPLPAELVGIRKPILGFWGLIQDWVDLGLLAEIARARPDWSIALIGEAVVDTGSIRGIGNLHLLGRRPYAALPAYARGFAAGLIPFRINGLTRAVNPIKLREYLSAGLPVVSSPLPEVEAYRPHVLTASTPEEWIVAIEQAIRSRSGKADQARRELMRDESWESKVEQVCEILQGMGNRGGPGVLSRGEIGGGSAF